MRLAARPEIGWREVGITDQGRCDPVLGAAPDGLSAERLRGQTRQGIGAWNELGRALCGRFLDVAIGPERRC